jgi:L-2,4-diaminobutyrate decarboxylase
MPFLNDAEIVAQALDVYYQESVAAEKPVIHLEKLGDIVEDLDLDSYARQGGLTGEKLADFVEKYLATTTRLHHPEYLAHQVAIPYYSGSLGSMIDGFTNNGMAVYEMGPGATAIETFVINWMLEKVGWQPAPLDMEERSKDIPFGGGILTHGGSLANLTALVMARNVVAPDVWQNGVPNDLAVLTPAVSHYSIARAAGILGLGQKAIYSLEVDECGAVIPEKLAETYQRARNDGKRVMAVTANACTTPVGIYDPLDEISDFCRANRVWLHVDGAHGASALVSPKYRRLMKGIEKANSITWDAHKMLQAPTLCAALLVRDHRGLDTAFHQEASYLFHEKEQPGIDVANRTVECTKAGLGLRFFLVLGALGEGKLGEFVERQYDLTQQAYDYIQSQPDFVCPVRPQSNILCFRVEGSDRKQLQIRDTLNARGRFYLSSTIFKDKRYLRFSLMNPNTHFEDIQRMIAMVRQVAQEV